MNICFISEGSQSLDVLRGDSRNSGGAEAQVAYLAQNLADIGHQVHLIYGQGETTGATSMHSNVCCIDAYPRWKRPQSLYTFWSALRRAAPVVIYARQPSDFLWMAGLFSKLRREARFVYALAHDQQCNPWRTYTYNRWFHDPLYALGLYSADVVALQHAGQAALARPYVRANLVTIPNLVQSVASTAREYDETAIDAIWVAKIRADKQLHIFLDVAEELPDLRFALVGGFDPNMDGILRGELEHRMRHVKNMVTFGARRFDEVIRLIAQSKILINTSSYEGFPNTMLEAWSVGVPVVSLAVDPGKVIEREQIGLVSGSVNQLVSDADRLARARALNQAMGERGLAYVRGQHSFAAVYGAFAQILPEGGMRTEPIQKGSA